MKFAKARGFDFTKDEINELQDTLTDDELESVAGGCADQRNPGWVDGKYCN